MAGLADRILAIVGDYDAYVRDQARAPFKQRIVAHDMIVKPWAVAEVLALCATFLLRKWFWLALPIPAAFYFCGGWASVRFNRYCREFDRTPPDAPWAQTAEAQVLFLALHRFAAGPIATLTPQTRLQDDRKMSSQDMTALFAVLREQAELDDRAVARARRGGLTIWELLESIHLRAVPATSSRTTSMTTSGASSSM